jgi:ABC-type Mn2+/Zn2+ transport system ATPase subunit
VNLLHWVKKSQLLLADYNSAKLRVKEEKVRLRQSWKKVRWTEEAQKIVQLVAENVQNQVHSRISGVVSRCLEAVFGGDLGRLEFKIRFERKRGKTDAILEFLDGGITINDPVNELGMGVIEVAAFALRLACVHTVRPAISKLLILDEPFKSIHSPVYRQRMANLLMELSMEMDFQIIIVTGIPEYEIGTVIRLK